MIDIETAHDEIQIISQKNTAIMYNTPIGITMRPVRKINSRSNAPPPDYVNLSREVHVVPSHDR